MNVLLKYRAAYKPFIFVSIPWFLSHCFSPFCLFDVRIFIQWIFVFVFNIMRRLKLFESFRSWLWILRYFFVWPFHVGYPAVLSNATEFDTKHFIICIIFDAIDTSNNANSIDFHSEIVAFRQLLLLCARMFFSNVANWNLRTHNELSRWYLKKKAISRYFSCTIPDKSSFILRIEFLNPLIEAWVLNHPWCLSWPEIDFVFHAENCFIQYISGAEKYPKHSFPQRAQIPTHSFKMHSS